MTQFDQFKEAYSVFENLVNFKVDKRGKKYVIKAVNKFTGVNQIWKHGTEDLVVDHNNYQKIKLEFKI